MAGWPTATALQAAGPSSSSSWPRASGSASATTASTWPTSAASPTWSAEFPRTSSITSSATRLSRRPDGIRAVPGKAPRASSWTAARRAPESRASLPRHAADAPPGPRLPSHTPGRHGNHAVLKATRGLHSARTPSPQAAASLLLRAGAAQSGPPGRATGASARHKRRHGARVLCGRPGPACRVSRARDRNPCTGGG